MQDDKPPGFCPDPSVPSYRDTVNKRAKKVLRSQERKAVPEQVPPVEKPPATE